MSGICARNSSAYTVHKSDIYRYICSSCDRLGFYVEIRIIFGDSVEHVIKNQYSFVQLQKNCSPFFRRKKLIKNSLFVKIVMLTFYFFIRKWIKVTPSFSFCSECTTVNCSTALILNSNQFFKLKSTDNLRIFIFVSDFIYNFHRFRLIAVAFNWIF